MKHPIFTLLLILSSSIVSAQVDLSVNQVNITLNSGSKGQYFMINAIISNIGTEDCSNYTLNLYLSSDSILDKEQDTFLDSILGDTLIAGVNNVSVSTGFNFPINISKPTTKAWYLFAEVEAKDGHTEPNNKLGNNYKSEIVTIYDQNINSKGFYDTDMAIQRVYVRPSSGYPGDYFTANAYIGNLGNQSCNSYTVKFYVSESLVLNEYSDRYVGSASGPSLLPNDHYTVSSSFYFPADMSSLIIKDYYIHAKIETFGDMNSGNNTDYQSVTIYPKSKVKATLNGDIIKISGISEQEIGGTVMISALNSSHYQTVTIEDSHDIEIPNKLSKNSQFIFIKVVDKNGKSQSFKLFNN